MQRFLFWARLFGEQAYFRSIWAPLRELANITQSQLILFFDGWIDRSLHEVSGKLKRIRRDVQARLETDEELLDQALRIFTAGARWTRS